MVGEGREDCHQGSHYVVEILHDSVFINKNTVELFGVREYVG